MLASKLIAIKSGADLTKLARWKRAARCLIDKLIRLRLSSCGTSVRFSKPQTGDAPYSSRLSVQDRDVLYLISSDVCCTRKPQFQASEIARNLRVPWIKAMPADSPTSLRNASAARNLSALASSKLVVVAWPQLHGRFILGSLKFSSAH